MKTVYVDFDKYRHYPRTYKKSDFLLEAIEVSDVEASFLLSISAAVGMAVELIENKLKEQRND